MRGWSKSGEGIGAERHITVDGPILYPYTPLGLPMAIPDAFVDEYNEVRSTYGGGPYATKIYPLGSVPVTYKTKNNFSYVSPVTHIDGIPFDDDSTHNVGVDIRDVCTSIQPGPGVQAYPNKVATPYSLEGDIIAYNKDNGYACVSLDYFIFGFGRGLNTDTEGKITVNMKTNPSVVSAFSGTVKGGSSVYKQNKHYAQTGSEVTELLSMDTIDVRGITLGPGWGGLKIAYRNGDVLHYDRLYANTTPTKGSYIMQVSTQHTEKNYASNKVVHISETDNAPTAGTAAINRGIMYNGKYPSTFEIFQHIAPSGVCYLGVKATMGIGGMAYDTSAAGINYGIVVFGAPRNMEYPNQVKYPDWNNETAP